MSRRVPPPPDARFRVVLDAEDDRAHNDAFLAVASLAASRVVARARPGKQNTVALGHAVLEALGKELDRVRTNGGGAGSQWQRCPGWLRAECVSELLVVRAQWLDRRCWTHLLGLAAQADCGLTLVLSGQELDGWRERLVNDWASELLTFDQWHERYGTRWAGEARAQASTEHEPWAFPPLPSSDFTLFRADCCRLLLPEDFAVVDACWCAARQATGQWMSSGPGVDEVGVAQFLRDLVRPARSFNEVVTRLRGAQAAFFLAGWLVKVNDERLAASAGEEPYDLLNTATAQLLRGFVAPSFAAAATVALVLREPPEELANLRLADIAENGRAVRWQDTSVEVPHEFSPFLRAQRLQRAQEGAHGDEALFVATAGDRTRHVDDRPVPMTGRAVQQALTTVVRETGVLVTSSFSSRPDNSDAERWTHRRGVSIYCLSAPPSPWRKAA